jgi:hypothetical protein
VVQQLLERAEGRRAGSKAGWGSPRGLERLDPERLARDLAPLSENERRAYFDANVLLSARVRPQVIKGQPFYVAACVDSLLPCDMRLRLDEIRSSTGQVFTSGAEFLTSGGLGGLFGPMVLDSQAVLDQPGKCTLTLKVDIRAMVAPPRDGTATDDIEFHDTRTITAEVEVLPEEPPDFVRLVHTDGGAIADCLTLSAVRQAREANASVLECTLSSSDDLPVSLVLRGYAEIAGQRVPLKEPVVVAAGRFRDHVGSPVLRFSYGGDPPTAIAIVLQTDKARALQGTIFDEIWDGELRIENIGVVRGDAFDYDRARRVPIIREPDSTW